MLVRALFFFLTLSSLAWGKSETQPITLKSLDQTQTTLAIFELSVLTLLPVLTMVTIESRPGFRNETYITASLLSIPVLLGWPLLFHELSVAKDKKIPLSNP